MNFPSKQDTATNASEQGNTTNKDNTRRETLEDEETGMRVKSRRLADDIDLMTTDEEKANEKRLQSRWSPHYGMGIIRRYDQSDDNEWNKKLEVELDHKGYPDKRKPQDK